MKILIRFAPVLALSMLGALSGCAMQNDSTDLGDEIATGDEAVGEAESALSYGTCAPGTAGCVQYSITSGVGVWKGSCTQTLEARAPGGAWIKIATGTAFYSSTGVDGLRGTLVGTGLGCIVQQTMPSVTRNVAGFPTRKAMFNTAYPAIQATFGCNANRIVPTASAIAPAVALTAVKAHVTTVGFASGILSSSGAKCEWFNNSSWHALVSAGTTASTTTTGLAFL
jgi:hypothetical protein